MARPRTPFRAKNLSVNLAATGKLAQTIDKLKICILHTQICLGWTQCKLFTNYCLGWISWCRLFTCRGGSIHCQGAYSWVACRVGTLPDLPDCGVTRGDPGPEILVDPEVYSRQVTELKADLQEALRQLEVHEREIADLTKGD